VKIRVLAVGTRMPAWVDAGVDDYLRRLPAQFRAVIEEIRPVKRAAGDTARVVAEEGSRILEALSRTEFAVALDVHGRSMSTEQLAQWLGERMRDGRDLAFIIGGADGLSQPCLARCELHWSLSPLTFPHGLVRVLVTEQLYRAISLLQGHPYHRA
jgi:23S rRNA (pseudouridine1915-N3)-methyltransferase